MNASSSSSRFLRCLVRSTAPTTMKTMRRCMATYIPTEKVLFHSFNREYQVLQKKWTRDVEINTMKAGLAYIKSKGFELEDAEGSANMKLKRAVTLAEKRKQYSTRTSSSLSDATTEAEKAPEVSPPDAVNEEHAQVEQQLFVTIDFDIWSRCMQASRDSGTGRANPPETYDIIVRKTAPECDHYLVVTCVNDPDFLPVGCRVVPNDVEESDLRVYGGPKFTRLPQTMLKGLIEYLSSLGVDEELGRFIHLYIDFKVRKEQFRALGGVLNTVLKQE